MILLALALATTPSVVPPSTPRLGTVEARCRPNEPGPALIVDVDGLKDRAWSYPTPYPTAFDRVGKDFSGYLAFWKDVKVVD